MPSETEVPFPPQPCPICGEIIVALGVSNAADAHPDPAVDNYVVCASCLSLVGVTPDLALRVVPPSQCGSYPAEFVRNVARLRARIELAWIGAHTCRTHVLPN